MMDVIVKPSQLWAYYKDNQKDMTTSMHMVASNKDFGVEIYLCDDEGHPNLSIHVDETLLLENICISKNDLEDTAEEMYDTYLTNKAIGAIAEIEEANKEEEVDNSDEQFDIDVREYDLDVAVADFVNIATDNLKAHKLLSEEAIDDIKDHFLQYLYLKHGLEIYRPMFLEFEDGTEEFKTHPYPDLELEDEDNPIYKKESVKK